MIPMMPILPAIDVRNVLPFLLIRLFHESDIAVDNFIDALSWAMYFWIFSLSVSFFLFLGATAGLISFSSSTEISSRTASPSTSVSSTSKVSSTISVASAFSSTTAVSSVASMVSTALSSISSKTTSSTTSPVES